LIEAVVAAVGFVGAGAILRSSRADHVRGLTTASSLLMASAIGIAAGLGSYLLAFGASVLCLVVLAVFRRVEHRIAE
jgi:putative Mg2+ transporter-C (MgtC) family protein